MSLSVCFILILVPIAFASEMWRDPHEIKIARSDSTNRANSDLELGCQRKNTEEIKVLMYYKRSLKMLTKHLVQKRGDGSSYDFNLRIDAQYYDDLMLAVEDISYDLENLQRLDNVLSRVEGKKFEEKMRDMFLNWSEYIRMNWFSKEAAVLGFILMLVIMVYCYKNASKQTILLIVIFVIWATDFGLTWFNKYQDLEVDHMVDISRYASSEPTCDLTKMWFYERWFSTLSPTEECRRFYTAKYKNRNYQIGPYDIVIEQVGKLMKIFRFVAIESSNFLLLITANIPWPLNWIIIIAVVILGFYIVILILFLLFGYSFQFNIAHLINFNIQNDQHPRINRENREFREVLQEIKQIPNRMSEAFRDITNVLQRNQHEILLNPQARNMPIGEVEQLIPVKSNTLTQTKRPSNLTTSDTMQPSEALTEQSHNIIDHRPEIIQETTCDREDSSSESIEIVADSNRNADFEEYVVVVNQTSGNAIRNMEFD